MSDAAQPAPQPKAPRPYACRHLFTDGHQCGSPALRGEALCFYHHASRRPQQHQTVHGYTPIALPEPLDLHAVQRGLAELLRLVALNALPAKQASLLLRNLTIASQNLARIDRQTAAARKLNPERLPVDDYTNHPTLGTIAPAPLVPAEAVPTPSDPALNHQLMQQPALLPLEPTPRPEGPLPDPASLFTPEPVVTDRPSAQALADAENRLARTLERTARQIHDRAERRARLAAAYPGIPALPGSRHDRGDSDFLQSFPQLAPPVAALEAPTQPAPDFQTYPQPNEDFGLFPQSPATQSQTALEYADACA